MGINNFHDSGVMELARNIMIMTIIALFIIMIFIIFVRFFSKHHRQAIEQTNNHACEQRGLDNSLLKTIQVIEFDPKSFKQGLECAVCLSDVEEGEKARILPKCDHGFHMECIDMWFHSHSTCPICRNPVSDHQSDEQQESSVVLFLGDETNNHHHRSNSEQASSSSSLSKEEEDPVPCSGMRSLTRILSGSRRFNGCSLGSDNS